MADNQNFVPVRAHLRRTGGSASDVQQGHAPDVQAEPMEDDGTDLLPMGSSTESMFGEVTDGASTDTGYLVIGNEVVNAPPPMPRDGYFDPVPHEEREGFAGRPQGYER